MQVALVRGIGMVLTKPAVGRRKHEILGCLAVDTGRLMAVTVAVKPGIN